MAFWPQTKAFNQNTEKLMPNVKGVKYPSTKAGMKAAAAAKKQPKKKNNKRGKA
jgi:hypothetical protein